MDPGVVALVDGRFQGKHLGRRSIIIAGLAPVASFSKLVSAETVGVAESCFHVFVLRGEGVEPFQSLDGRRPVYLPVVQRC